VTRLLFPNCLAVLAAIALHGVAAPARAAAPDDPPYPRITASSVHDPSYAAPLAVDGNAETRWASRLFHDKPEWLQIDFGRPVAVSRLVIAWEAAYAAAYKVQISSDGRKWLTATERTDAKGGREVIEGLNAAGRFLRILCLRPGSYPAFSIWELEFSDAEALKILSSGRSAVVRPAGITRAQAVRSLHQRGILELVFAMRKSIPDGHWYANIGYYAERDGPPLPEAAHVEGKNVAYVPGGRLCRLDVASGGVTVLLDDPEGGVRDPFVDYDGGTILFSYRKGRDPFYHLYSIAADGTGLRQLTDGTCDDIEPCRVPDGGIVFVSTRCHRWVNCWCTQVAILHRCDADGSNVLPLSSNNEHDNTPWVLPDGRILYTRWEYIDRSQVDYHHLWSMNPDGTGQAAYYGNQRPGVVMIDAKPIPGTNSIAAIFSPGHGMKDHAGRLTEVRPDAGPDAPESAVPVHPSGDLRDPWPLGEGLYLAASGSSLVALDDQAQLTELFVLSEEDRRQGFQLHEPRPLVARAREPLIPARVQPEMDTSRLLLADVHLGRNMGGVKQGDIRKLLVLESLPKPINFTGGMEPLTYGGSFTLERVLGTVPVEADGSAWFEVPAVRSLILVALDENDLSVKRMQSFLSVQPGEIQSCIGCHEQRTSSLLPSRNLLALQRAPSRIEPVADAPDVFDFPRDIQPILDRLCADCHGCDTTPAGGPYAGRALLTGDRGPLYSHAYFTLTTMALFSDGRNLARSNYEPRTLGSSASRILKMIDGSHHEARATDRERTVLRLWIEAGAPYIGTYAGLGTGMIGGYAINRQVVTDFDWPTTQAAAEAIDRRCGTCHKDNGSLPRALSDERNMSFWRFDQKDPRHRYNRHILFNLSRPEKSLLLLAPLAMDAGGFGLCADTNGQPAKVFADRMDPDYGKLLAMVAAGKSKLDGITRFDMENFQPRPEYLREMMRYGILPADFEPGKTRVDVYELDRAYWKSLWYKPRAL